jgi:hypothetical protein
LFRVPKETFNKPNTPRSNRSWESNPHVPTSTRNNSKAAIFGRLLSTKLIPTLHAFSIQSLPKSDKDRSANVLVLYFSSLAIPWYSTNRLALCLLHTHSQACRSSKKIRTRLSARSWLAWKDIELKKIVTPASP